MLKNKPFLVLLVVLSIISQSLFSQSEWTIVATYEVPGKASGLAWDGTHIYYGIYGASGSNVYQFDPVSGSSQLHFTNPQIGDSYGMTFDGQNLWVIDRANTGNSYALQLSLDGNILGQFSLPQQYMSGIAADASDFWVSSYYPDPGWIYKVDQSGNILDQFAPPMNQTWDIAIDDGSMWIVDYNGNMVFKTDLQGNIIEEHSSITERPSGIVFDGTYLWYVAGPLSGISTLYKVDPGGAGAPQLSINQTSFDFGNVTVGSDATISFSVSNTGNAPLEISFTQAAPGSQVILPQGTYMINGGESSSFDAVFTPITHQHMEESAQLFSNDPLQPNVLLSFSGTALQDGPYITSAFESHAFSNVRTLGSRKQNLTIQNWGNENLSIEAINLENPHFYLGDYPALPLQLAPLGMFNFDIWFFPQESGNFETTLNILSNSVQQNNLAVDFTGIANESFFPIGGTIWQSLIDDPYDSSPKAIIPLQDISGDTKAEVVIASEDDYIRAFNGNASDFGQVLWEREIYSGSVYQQQALVSIEDINEDEIEDIIVGTAWGDRSVLALSGKTGEIIWKFQTNIYGSGGWVYQVDAGFDYNGDGFPDVLASTGNDGTNTGPKRVFCLNGKTGQIIWEYYFNGAVYAVMGIPDANSDNIPDVIAGGANASETEGRLVAISGATGYQMWESTTSGSAAYALQQLDDINADGIQDIVVGSFNGHLYLINPVNGNILQQNYLGNVIILKLITMDDLNGDGFTDIVPAHSGYNIAAINGLNGEYIWSESSPDKPWNIQRIPDINGDSINDIAYGTLYVNNYAIFVDGVSGQQLFSEAFGEAIDAIGVIPDVNGDESWEMVVGGRNGKVVCYAGGPDGITSTFSLPSLSNRLEAYPNPFTEKCYITIYWPRSTRVSLTIYKLNGSRVYETNLNVTNQNPANWEWDGQSSSGEKLPQGIYLLEINDGYKKEIHKLMHLSATK